MFANIYKKLYQHNNLLNKITFPTFICPKNNSAIDFDSSVFMIGSCFSENISTKLSQRKISCCSNPSGILFDTLSIENTVYDIVNKKKFSNEELILKNEIYHSWSHHSDFSSTESQKSTKKINESNSIAFEKLKKAKFIIITLGSAFSYYHLESDRYVANCHKVPQKEFRKEMISSEVIYNSLKNIQSLISEINSNINIILTISPVRHLRDGIIENNRSKARLIEAVHRFISENENSYYFPSYEIVIDLLRDYRYYDIDFAHPNYQATEIVFQYFKESCISKDIWDDMDKFYNLYISTQHRSRNPDTNAHKKFLENQFKLAKEYQENYQQLSFKSELEFFKTELNL